MALEGVEELGYLIEVKIYVFYHEGVVLLQGCQPPSEKTSFGVGTG